MVLDKVGMKLKIHVKFNFMKNNEKLELLTNSEMENLDAGGFFFDLGRSVGSYANRYFDDIASGRLVATHSGMGAYQYL